MNIRQYLMSLNIKIKQNDYPSISKFNNHAIVVSNNIFLFKSETLSNIYRMTKHMIRVLDIKNGKDNNKLSYNLYTIKNFFNQDISFKLDNDSLMNVAMVEKAHQHTYEDNNRNKVNIDFIIIDKNYPSSLVKDLRFRMSIVVNNSDSLSINDFRACYDILNAINTSWSKDLCKVLLIMHKHPYHLTLDEQKLLITYVGTQVIDFFAPCVAFDTNGIYMNRFTSELPIHSRETVIVKADRNTTFEDMEYLYMYKNRLTYNNFLINRDEQIAKFISHGWISRMHDGRTVLLDGKTGDVVAMDSFNNKYDILIVEPEVKKQLFTDKVYKQFHKVENEILKNLTVLSKLRNLSKREILYNMEVI